MRGSEWIESVRHIGTDFKALAQAVLDAVDQELDVQWPWQAIDAGNGIIFYVMADYFAIGEPDDYVYIPLDPVTAEKICRLRGWTFPTKRMVELTFEQSDCKVFAVPGKSGPWGPPYDARMFSVARIEAFNKRTQNQIAEIRAPLAVLRAGHRKDLVLTNELETHHHKLAYWGWFREDGSPIQGPYVGVTQHWSIYFDYSHGFRPVLLMGRAHGIQTPVKEMLQHGTMHKALCGIDALHGKVEPLRVLNFPIEGEPWPAPPEDEAEKPIPDNKHVPAAMPTVRLTRPYMRDTKQGKPVIALLQEVIGVSTDGVFGSITERGLKEYQRKNGLVADGICGPKTWAVVLGPDLYEDNPVDELAIAFMQARAYHKANRGKGDIDWIVIHTMEAAEHPGTAENVGAWFAGPNHPRASTHYNIDCDSIVQNVYEKDVAWHAPGCNRRGIGLEHAGYAHQLDDRAGWKDDYSIAMLKLSAKLTARIAKRHDIPLQFVDAEGLKNGKRGVTFHVTATEAFELSDHTDPGEYFPIDWYLDIAREELAKLS
jgi:peptidoglycan hydrolase-like protein with peptidoglycan-binding domain/N-acetyl-anhydromuramyl-L-alanine amidase AmpD